MIWWWCADGLIRLLLARLNNKDGPLVQGKHKKVLRQLTSFTITVVPAEQPLLLNFVLVNCICQKDVGQPRFAGNDYNGPPARPKVSNSAPEGPVSCWVYLQHTLTHLPGSF